MGKYSVWKRGTFSLHYWEAGTGKTVLFFHGGGLPASSYREAKRTFSERFHVVVPDMPGFGESDFPTGIWDYGDYADLMAEFVRSRGMEVDYIAGYSCGGGIAIELARRLPSVKKLILFSPGVQSFPYRHGMIPLLIAAEGVCGFAHALRAGRMGVFLRIARDFIFCFIRRPFRQARVLEIIMRCFLARPGYSELAVPTEIVSVKSDRFFPPEAGRRLAEEIPDCTWRLLPGIHLSFMLDHERVSGLLPR
jgi:pimeloyl-ACP methyl ester carboxylesterase